MTAQSHQPRPARLSGLMAGAASALVRMVGRLLATILFFWCADAASVLAADDSVTADTITFGQTAALEGPATREAFLRDWLTRHDRMEKVFITMRMYSKSLPDIAHDKVYGITTFELG